MNMVNFFGMVYLLNGGSFYSYVSHYQRVDTQRFAAIPCIGGPRLNQIGAEHFPVTVDWVAASTDGTCHVRKPHVCFFFFGFSYPYAYPNLHGLLFILYGMIL